MAGEKKEGPITVGEGGQRSYPKYTEIVKAQKAGRPKKNVTDIPPTHAHLPLATNALCRFPPEVTEQILFMMAEGIGHRKINAYLAACDIDISETHLARLISQERHGKAPIAKEIVRASLEPSINSDLDSLSTLKHQLETLAAKYFKGTKDDHQMYLKIVDRIKVVVDTRLHYSGADVKDADAELDASASRVTEKILHLLDKAIPSPAVAGEDMAIDVKFVDDGTESLDPDAASGSEGDESS